MVSVKPASPDPLTKNDLERAAQNALLNEGVSRIAGFIPDLDTLEKIQAVASLSGAVDFSVDANLQNAASIYSFVKSRLPDVENLTREQLESFDASTNDPFGDGDGWPA